MYPSVFPGLYCSGWLKTGPTGVIATTMNNSFDTAHSVVEDMESGTVDVSAARPGSQSISGLLEERGTLLSLWLFLHILLSSVIWPGSTLLVIYRAIDPHFHPCCSTTVHQLSTVKWQSVGSHLTKRFKTTAKKWKTAVNKATVCICFQGTNSGTIVS